MYSWPCAKHGSGKYKAIRESLALRLVDSDCVTKPHWELHTHQAEWVRPACVDQLDFWDVGDGSSMLADHIASNNGVSSNAHYHIAGAVAVPMVWVEIP